MKMFSRTESSGATYVSWKTVTMPARCAASGSGGAQRLALPAQVAGVGRQDAAEDLDQRALAGSVLAREGVDLAAAHGEVGALQRARLAERAMEVADLQHRLGHTVLETRGSRP